MNEESVEIDFVTLADNSDKQKRSRAICGSYAAFICFSKVLLGLD